MEKFMRGDILEKFPRGYRNGRPIGVFHPAAGARRPFANVKNKRVALVRSSVAHQLDFVFTDTLQITFNCFFFQLSP